MAASAVIAVIGSFVGSGAAGGTPIQEASGGALSATNAAWILSVQFDQLWLSLPVIVALLAVLARAFVLCLRIPPAGTIDAIITDGTVGLYLGWVSIATAANATALLVASGFTGFGLSADVWAVIVLAVAGAVGVLIAVKGRGRIAPALSLSWGLVWVAVGRLAGELVSVPAGIAALVAAVVVLAVTAIMRVRASAA